MFLTPLTLVDISKLRNPSERVPLAERSSYEDALKLLETGGFKTCHVELGLSPLARADVLFYDEFEIFVEIYEDAVGGVVSFQCEHCKMAPNKSCRHQWAAFVLIWQALVLEKEDIPHPAHKKLARELKSFMAARHVEKVGVLEKYQDVRLNCVSLYFDEPALFQGKSLAKLIRENTQEGDFKYKFREVSKEDEVSSPLNFDLPEVFRRKLTAYSGHYLNEINKQNRLTETVRYNFSNGMQLSAREIFRHPLGRLVPKSLLPQNKKDIANLARWPLLQPAGDGFLSQAVLEVEEIMKALLERISEQHRRGILQVYLQGPSTQEAIQVKNIEFDASQEVMWRVEFSEKQGFEAEFKLTSLRKKTLAFYHSLAVESESGTLVVHPWMREFSELQDFLTQISDMVPALEGMPTLHVDGEATTKMLLKHLRGRFIPVEIMGNSKTVPAHKSLTEVRLNEAGTFYLQHEAQVPGQKNIARKGWSSRSSLFLQTLSQGLSFILNVEARDLASKTVSKREWDLKLLKHLGILQYVFFETLSVQFDGMMTDGRVVQKEDLFDHLEDRIQKLLIWGADGAFLKETPLREICSKSVILYFSDFIQQIFDSIKTSESFYSEEGEVVMEGVVEREFRVIFELLKHMAVTTNGDIFKRSRVSLLSKVSQGEHEFYFPTGDSQKASSLHDSLEGVQRLLPYGFRVYYKDQPLQELTEDEFQVDFRIKGDTDQRHFNWFELNPKFFLRGEEVNPDQLLNLGGGGVIEYDGKLYLVPQKQMPSLKRLERFWERLQNGKKDSKWQKGMDRIYKLPRNQTLELLALRASGVGIRGDHQWKKLCDFYDSLGSVKSSVEIPEHLQKTLKPYQSHGVQWLNDLYELRLGALLADDMGLGKTLQTLAFLEILRDKSELGSVLVVVPSSLIFNWQQEIEKFTPELPFFVFSGKNIEVLSRRLVTQKNLVVIATYGLLMEHSAFLNQYKWQIAIFDEAQNLKNITTKRTSSARSLTAQFKICLTGTPMENHYGEFYSLVDLLVPGSMGPISDFRKQFVNTEIISRSEMQDLKLKIRPLLLRRSKKEILAELPEKQETKVSIAFEEKQKEIYRDIALSYNQRVQETMQAQGTASVQLQMLTALLRLRQACSDPAGLPNVKYPHVPPKMVTLLESLEEIVESGESALVFTQFLQTLQHTSEILKKSGIPVFVLHGGVPTKQRQETLAAFNATKGGAVLIMTLKTGGVGLNLTKASYVFHLEPWWNPAVENQATDRAHRMGQTKAIQVFRYIMHESLEEKIEVLKGRKDKKFQSLFSDNEKASALNQGSEALSKEDFDLLLGLKN